MPWAYFYEWPGLPGRRRATQKRARRGGRPGSPGGLSGCRCHLLSGRGRRLGVSLLAAQLAKEYGLAYCTPAFAIHRKGRYGGIVGLAYSDMAEYRGLVARAKSQGASFIKLMFSGLLDFDVYGHIFLPATAGRGNPRIGDRGSRGRTAGHGPRQRPGNHPRRSGSGDGQRTSMGIIWRRNVSPCWWKVVLSGFPLWQPSTPLPTGPASLARWWSACCGNSIACCG